MDFAAGKTNRGDASACLANAFTNADSCFQRSTLRSEISSNAQFCDISVKTRSLRWNGAAFVPQFADSMPMLNASKSSST